MARRRDDDDDDARGGDGRRTHRSDNSVDQTGRDQLRSFVERIERLQDEKDTIASDMKDVYGEAKGTGFDVKQLRKLIMIRKKDKDERLEEEAILETYMIALGMI